ncbi:photosystem II reaction center protein Psb28 [Leptolyngbya sp. FACHB-261]|uniref:photosystem II reaction center protein Psb28 n=1 Tax=Leptolyngbya sp. FACHB-261 TaxID=2692806 RepID=UPI001689E2C8|nr:photosystem II reaction center protein Psb28 [Leptolyngbya sp. FACHB-261]MBD2105215.1 photosystem II reaction center protein Psb28 [Leptolyngbya sp. FACHB-261]
MASIQFARGVDEEVTNVRLTRSKDGLRGTATFFFEKPRVMNDADVDNRDITGMWMIDDEGELVTRTVNAKFVNGQPAGVEAIYRMDGSDEWERFMRFMERYAASNDLGFSQS